jgi:hypothetical protein
MRIVGRSASSHDQSSIVTKNLNDAAAVPFTVVRGIHPLGCTVVLVSRYCEVGAQVGVCVKSCTREGERESVVLYG